MKTVILRRRRTIVYVNALLTLGKQSSRRRVLVPEYGPPAPLGPRGHESEPTILNLVNQVT